MGQQGRRHGWGGGGLAEVREAGGGTSHCSAGVLHQRWVRLPPAQSGGWGRTEERGEPALRAVWPRTTQQEPSRGKDRLEGWGFSARKPGQVSP